MAERSITITAKYDSADPYDFDLLMQGLIAAGLYDTDIEEEEA